MKALSRRRQARRAQLSFTGSRRLLVEKLEDRVLLAGDTYLINFQPADAPVPVGYAPDTGAVYGVRANGWSYGWSAPHDDVARDRDSVADQRLDTLIHFHAGQVWELGLPDGLYQVTVAIGDADFSSFYKLNVEDVSVWNDPGPSPWPAGIFRTETRQVLVDDGRLTLDQGSAGEMATRINYIQVVGLGDGASASPTTPTITEPVVEGDIVNPADVHMEAGGFFDIDGNSHLSTDWEIWTTGPNPERVWHTLGITGVERVHTHLGDGFFENSHAGRTELISDTVPNYNYNTYTITLPNVSAGDHLTIRAEMIDSTGASGPSLSGMVDAFTLLTPGGQNLIDDGSFELAFGNTQTSNSNWVMATENDGVEPSAQFQTAPWAASSGNNGVWFKGFRGTPSTPVDASVTQVVTATTSGTYTLQFDAKVEEFFADHIGAFRVTISSDGTGGSKTIDLLNSHTPEYQLRVRFRDDAGAVSAYATRNFLVGSASTVFPMELEGIADAPAPQWLDADEQNVILPAAAPTPAELRLTGAQGELLLSIAGFDGLSNTVTNPPALAEHINLRVVITAGSTALQLGESDVFFSDDDGRGRAVYLPAINLGAGGRLDLWVGADGSTYIGSAGQTEPDFSVLARAAELPIPFIVLEPGYEIEEVAGGLQLPVNIAFVPNPGPNPGDPLFYINELYGTIKVVTNDFTVSTYASNLLNFDPTGIFPGSGELGLAGLVVDPVSGDVFVSRASDSDGVPGGVLHPQVVRLHSNDGGLTAATETVIRNMVGETQGQSHQVSNLTIGPDGKLYVHNGDGFDPSTALNLDSYRGKILRMNLDGTAPTDNPFYNTANGINAQDYIYAYGFRNPFGGAWRASDGMHYEVENGNALDRLARIESGGDYGWDGSDASLLPDALYVWNPAHAPVNITFIQPETFGGSLYPGSKQDHAFVSESGPTYGLGQQTDGKRILEFELDANGNVLGASPFVEYVGTGRGTVAGLIAGPDGLYFTELYKDLDVTTPIDPGARVFRVRYTAGGDADFDLDGDVDGLDFLSWQRGYGHPNAGRSDGDADNDDDVDGNDLAVWENEYGTGGLSAQVGQGATQSTLPPGSESLATATPTEDTHSTHFWLALPTALRPVAEEPVLTDERSALEVLVETPTPAELSLSRHREESFSLVDRLEDQRASVDTAFSEWDELCIALFF